MLPQLKTTFRSAAVLVALSVTSQAALVTGLVNYWNFNKDLGDSAQGLAGGSSTKADNGTFAGANGTNGVNFGAGLFAGGIALDGAAGAKQNNGYVNIARSADTLFGAGGSKLTTSMWVTVAGNDQDWQTALSHGEGAQYRFARRGNTATNMAYAGGAGDIGGSAVDLDVGGWHHIVGVSDGANGTRLWVDGVLDATAAAASAIDDARGGGLLNLHIGANPDTGAQNREWWGNIDDVAQWNRVLSDAEIKEIWGGGQATAKELRLLIPEPATGLLSVLGLGMMLRRRRR